MHSYHEHHHTHGIDQLRVGLHLGLHLPTHPPRPWGGMGDENAERECGNSKKLLQSCAPSSTKRVEAVPLSRLQISRVCPQESPCPSTRCRRQLAPARPPLPRRDSREGNPSPPAQSLLLSVAPIRIRAWFATMKSWLAWRTRYANNSSGRPQRMQTPKWALPADIRRSAARLPRCDWPSSAQAWSVADASNPCARALQARTRGLLLCALVF